MFTRVLAVMAILFPSTLLTQVTADSGVSKSSLDILGQNEACTYPPLASGQSLINNLNQEGDGRLRSLSGSSMNVSAFFGGTAVFDKKTLTSYELSAGMLAGLLTKWNSQLSNDPTAALGLVVEEMKNSGTVGSIIVPLATIAEISALHGKEEMTQAAIQELANVNPSLANELCASLNISIVKAPIHIPVEPTNGQVFVSGLLVALRNSDAILSDPEVSMNQKPKTIFEAVSVFDTDGSLIPNTGAPAKAVEDNSGQKNAETTFETTDPRLQCRLTCVDSATRCHIPAGSMAVF